MEKISWLQKVVKTNLPVEVLLCPRPRSTTKNEAIRIDIPPSDSTEEEVGVRPNNVIVNTQKTRISEAEEDWFGSR